MNEKEKLIVVGAGGHAMSVIDSIDANAIDLIGFIDEREELKSFSEIPVVGHSFEDICEPNRFSYFIAIGDNRARMAWYEKLKLAGARFVNIVDPSALVSEGAELGEANFIGKLAVINNGAVLGSNNIINTGALVEHRCRLGNHNHISTKSVMNGDVVVGDGVFLGSCAVVNGQLSIGSWSTIGSGASVVRDVPRGVAAVGVPAKVIKQGLVTE